jgi:hypothetical protein
MEVQIRMPKFTVSMLDTRRRFKKHVGQTLYEIMAETHVEDMAVRFPSQAAMVQLVKECFGAEIEVKDPETRYLYSLDVLIPAGTSLEHRTMFLARVACAAQLVPRRQKRTA